MSDLVSLGADIEWPDHESATVVREAFAGRSGYGRLAQLAEWAASVHALGAPFARVRGFTAGDNEHPETADAVGASLQALGELPEDVSEADELGVQRVDEEIKAGADLLLLALPGARADLPIAAAVLTNTEPVKVLARGAAATSPNAWMDLAVEVRDTRRRCMALRDKPDELLAGIGSARLAFGSAFAMRAATRRTPVLLDGPGAAVAALVAYEASPRAVRWWAAADLGIDPVHELALTRLGQKPILGLGSGLGDGLAGLLALPVLQAAVRLGGEAGAS